MSRPPFDILRAAFYLLAFVVISELGVTIFGAVGCFWLILEGRVELGSCSNIGTMAREVFAELLTAILALLLAGRIPPSSPPDKDSLND